MGVPDEARSNPGFYKTWNSIVDSGLLALMKGSEVKILNVIFRHRNRDTRQSFPSIPRMMAEAGLCRESVQAAVKRLISYGAVEKHRYRKGQKFYCVYSIPDNPIIKLPNKPEKSAGKEGQIREKSGRFGKLSKNPTNAYQPEKSAESNKPEKSALNKIETDFNNTEKAPLPSFKPTVNEETIKTFLELWGPERFRDYLRDNNYPIPAEVLLACKGQSQ